MLNTHDQVSYIIYSRGVCVCAHQHIMPDLCDSVQFSCAVVPNPTDYSTPGFPVPHHLPEFAQVYVHRIDISIQPSYLLLSPSPPALNLSQDQGPFK